MASTYTVGDLVAEFLAACGVTTAFGIASVHNIPMLDAIGRRNTIRFMMARGELGGAHMADGYARVSGGLGVIFSSTGPGAGNAVGGLVEARFAGSPVLHITGQTMTKFADRELGTVHDAYDQLGMLRVGVQVGLSDPLGPAGAGGADPRRDRGADPADRSRQRGGADRSATRGDRAPRFAGRLHPADPAPPRAPAAAELDELAARVLRGRRPMLWVGAGARQAGAEMRRLLDLGFTMVNSLQGRGMVPEDDPRTLGGLHGNGMPAIQDFYQTVDLMLVVGARLRGHETGDFSVKLPANLIQIDVDPMANGRTYPNQYFVCGDAKLALAGLLQRIEGRFQPDPALPEGLR